jgi:ankyrin repeat protein
MIERISDGRCDLAFDHIAAGGDPAARDEGGVPLIRWCAYYGDVSAIRHLLAHGESLDSLGVNLDLNGAAFHGHWQLCQFLIENGADANRKLEQTGETPLHAALSKANRPAAEHVAAILLNAGADPNAVTLAGAETGCFMRDSRTRGETPLHRAAAFGTEAAIRLLLDAGGSPAARDAYGDTPLSWASWHLRPVAVLRLVSLEGMAIHPEADWTGDHGAGWSGMDRHLLGKPHLRTARAAQ